MFQEFKPLGYEVLESSVKFNTPYVSRKRCWYFDDLVVTAFFHLFDLVSETRFINENLYYTFLDHQFFTNHFKVRTKHGMKHIFISHCVHAVTAA